MMRRDVTYADSDAATRPNAVPAPAFRSAARMSGLSAIHALWTVVCHAVLACTFVGPLQSATASGVSIPGLQVMYRLGLSPEACAVAGLGPTEASALLGRAEGATRERERLAAAEQTVTMQLPVMLGLEARARSTPTDQTAIQACQVAAEELADARAELISAEEALRSAVIVGLSTEALAVLEAWRDSAAYAVPPEFRAVARPNADWEALEQAVASERRSLRSGAPLDPSHSSTLAVFRGSIDVVTARERLTLMLPSIRSLFRSTP